MKARCAATILTTLTLAACGGGNGDNVGNAGNGNAGADAGERVMAFTDVTASSGIDLTTTGGRKPSTQIVEVKGCLLYTSPSPRDPD